MDPRIRYETDALFHAFVDAMVDLLARGVLTLTDLRAAQELAAVIHDRRQPRADALGPDDALRRAPDLYQQRVDASNKAAAEAMADDWRRAESGLPPRTAGLFGILSRGDDQ